MEKYQSGDCTICTKYFSLLHWHHTIPQALGGINSLQIPLCSDCHNVLHAHASAYVALITNNTKITRDYWPRPGDLYRAKPWLEILVNSILNPPVPPEDKEYKLHATVSSGVHSALNLLKSELNIKNMDKTILHCIEFTLKHRGLYNDRNTEYKRDHKRESGKKPKSSASDLW